MKVIGGIVIFLVFALVCPAAEERPEIGKVAWKRDLDASLDESRESGKPVLLLFQEVPG